MADAESSQKPQVQDPLAGRVLNGRFSILEPIGAGGMGKVYKAVQAPLDRLVALKVLHPQFANGKDPGFVKRFVLEAALTSKLRHPNTVTIIDYGQTEDGIFYIAMEYLEGQTVAEMLAKSGPIPWPRAVGIAQQVCRSLREAHKLGILHRDLKPANVMLLDEADSDVVKVLDFGLVKPFASGTEGAALGARFDAKLTQQGMLLGSPQYMAPEQAKNEGDQRSDIYSFGILLYEMLCGRAPFQGKDYLEVLVKHMKDPPPPMASVRPGLEIPEPVEAAVMRCLAKDMAARFQSMDQVLEALRSIAGVTGGVSGTFQGSDTGRWASPGAAPTPPPFSTSGSGVRPGLNTPAPHTKNPTGPFYQPFQPAQQGEASPEPAQALFGSITHVPAPPPAEPPPEPNVFTLGAEEQKSPVMLWAVGLAVLAAAAGGGYWLVTQKKAEPPPVAQEQKPAVQPQAQAAPAAPKLVRFKVSTDPQGAQVFVGARDVGRTPTNFELPAGPEGTATAELVFILDGFHPLAVTAGGSGDVLVIQRLQKKPEAVAAGGRVRRAAANREEEPEVAPASYLDRGSPSPGFGGTQSPAVVTPEPAAQPAAQAAPAPEPSRPVEPVAPSPVAAAAPKASGDEVLPFGDGMSRPELAQVGNPLRYPREAAAAGVQGLMIVKCVIATTGHLEHCRVLKPLPYMEQPILEMLSSRVYKPVTYQGKPVSVDYVFDVKVVPPKR